MPWPHEIANAIANRPEVLPSVAAGFDAVDLTPFFANPSNVFCGNEKGMALFAYLGDGRYVPICRRRRSTIPKFWSRLARPRLVSAPRLQFPKTAGGSPRATWSTPAAVWV